MVTQGFGATWTINAYNMVFLTAALLLQGSPLNLVKAVRQGATAASGIILQFPFYAGIFGVINNTGLGGWLGELFVRVGTIDTYPLVVYFYSGFMNCSCPRPIQMADRGAIPAPCCQGARRVGHHDRAGVRVRGLDDEPYSAVLGDPPSSR